MSRSRPIIGVAMPRTFPMIIVRRWIGTTARRASTQQGRSRPEQAWACAGDGRPPSPDIRQFYQPGHPADRQEQEEPGRPRGRPGPGCEAVVASRERRAHRRFHDDVDVRGIGSSPNPAHVYVVVQRAQNLGGRVRRMHHERDLSGVGSPADPAHVSLIMQRARSGTRGGHDQRKWCEGDRSSAAEPGPWMPDGDRYEKHLTSPRPHPRTARNDHLAVITPTSTPPLPRPHPGTDRIDHLTVIAGRPRTRPPITPVRPRT
jgi:hypothetical protein